MAFPLPDRRCGGELGDFGQVGLGQDGAVHESALDREVLVELLGELAEDTDGSDGVIRSGGQSRGAVEYGFETGEAGALQSEAEQSVLHDGVLNAGGGQLTTQLGVVGHIDALVVNDDTAAGLLNALRQSLDDGLLFAEYLCVRQ